MFSQHRETAVNRAISRLQNVGSTARIREAHWGWSSSGTASNALNYVIRRQWSTADQRPAVFKRDSSAEPVHLRAMMGNTRPLELISTAGGDSISLKCVSGRTR